ncbi:hypothetical protein ABZU32_06760 [Sphaerisporangium sp. NPDC005288]|uniref:hypothetical protein n=1 Tax=Sphaerisporangium sp. NPDC005288 TaxID=3155114 RepID=UPI0033B060D1
MSKAEDHLAEVVPIIVEVVVLQATPEGIVPVEGSMLVDLDSGAPLATEVVGQLLDSCVRLIAPFDVPYGLVNAVQQQTVPRAFVGDSWLGRHRALVFRDDRCVVEGYRLRYSRRFGVLIDDPPLPADRS